MGSVLNQLNIKMAKLSAIKKKLRDTINIP
jgi:hypothetical protein